MEILFSRRSISAAILLTLLLSVFSPGCATKNSPNISAVYKIPALAGKLPLESSKSKPQLPDRLPPPAQDLFIRLHEIDPSLAMEVGKLPEFQGQPNEVQIRSLRRFLDSISTASNDEKKNLKRFLDVGKPDSRRYCSPLQAIFWLFEKDDFDKFERPFTYSLDNLLKTSWKFSEHGRWRDYEVVTDRLNAPELIIFYEVRQFNYEHRRDSTGDPHKLFRIKKGHCVDAAEFTAYCLNKNGYSASIYKVITRDPWPHYATLVEIDGNELIVDNFPFGMTPLSRYKRE